MLLCTAPCMCMCVAGLQAARLDKAVPRWEALLDLAEWGARGV